jgi:uncharacterized protein YndB with AHSA1/START domain
MAELTLSRVPAMSTGMLVRRQPSEVFEAFVDPEITSKFWFSAGSARLQVGKPVKWDWEMYGISIEVKAKSLEPHRRIVIEWPGYKGQTTVEWTFEPHPDGTFVNVTESGFTGSGDELVQQVSDSTGGFCLVLAGLKAFLEHDLRLNLVRDRFPRGIGKH